MNEYQVTDKLIELLEDIASRKTAEEVVMEDGEDYFNIYECSGGNSDEAYYMGKDAGEIEMARTILHHLKEGK